MHFLHDTNSFLFFPTVLVMFANWLPADLIVAGGQEPQWRSSPVLVVAAISMAVFTGKTRQT